MFEIVSRLDRTHWQSEVYCLGPRGVLAELYEGIGIPVTCLNARSKLDLWKTLALRRGLKRFRPELLQTFLFHANLAGRICSVFTPIRRVVSGIRVSERRSRWPLRLDRWTQSLVAAHVCVSQAVADFSVEEARLAASKVHVIRNGVDFEHFATAQPRDLRAFNIPKHARVALFVGRLDPQKNPQLLVDAFCEAKGDPAASDLHLLFVGDGPLRDQVESLARHSQVSANIHFAGPQSDVAGLMRSATALVLPSRWEGMPNVVLEAMAAGLPVIASDVDGTSELIADGKTGVLFTSEDLNGLSAALKSTLADPSLAQQRAVAAQHVVEKHFTWESIAAEYDVLYRRLLGIEPS